LFHHVTVAAFSAVLELATGEEDPPAELVLVLLEEVSWLQPVPEIAKTATRRVSDSVGFFINLFISFPL